ncbi:MAG: cbb3-type cytochrome c oxidase subunit 3 [Pseudoxanthomonas sp.]
MVSGIVTAILLVLFIGGWIWAWSPRRKAEFEATARLPLEDDQEEQQP